MSTNKENYDIISHQITEDEAGLRLDKVIIRFCNDLSRSRIQKIIKDGNVEVNLKVEKGSYNCSFGDIINISVPPYQNTEIKAENIPLDIIYEDEDLVIINKEQGMVVHPAIGHWSGTLVNAILYHFQQLSSVNGEFRPGIVHRLDKDTSGLIIICKNDIAHKFLAEQLKDKSCSRKYYALIHGVLPHNTCKIDAPIGRHPTFRQKMQVISNGKTAVTNVNVLERFRDFSFIECSLETGRTHQIRVHLQYIHHPVAGDPVYGPQFTIAGKGQYLHAKEISFIHPRSNERLTFEAPLPANFLKVLEQLKDEGVVEVVKNEKNN